jgi:hypothetical protein
VYKPFGRNGFDDNTSIDPFADTNPGAIEGLAPKQHAKIDSDARLAQIIK